jgi:hypothetical protein
VGGSHDTSKVVAAVVTVVFNRPDYLRRHAASLLRAHGLDPGNRHAENPSNLPELGAVPHEQLRNLFMSACEDKCFKSMRSTLGTHA